MRIEFPSQRQCHLHRVSRIISVQSTSIDTQGLLFYFFLLTVSHNLIVCVFFHDFCINHSQDFSFNPEGSLRTVTIKSVLIYQCHKLGPLSLSLFVLLEGYR